MSEIMMTRLPSVKTKDDLVGLAARCDWFVESFLMRVKETDSPELIFLSVQQGYRSVPFFAQNVLPLIRHNCKVIIGSSDATFPNDIGDVRQSFFQNCREDIRQIVDNPYIVKIFVENLDSSEPKYYPIPLGILKNEFYPLYHDLLTNNVEKEKTINVLCCHRVRDGTQWDKRRHVSRLAKNEWKDIVTHIDENVDEHEFLQLLKRSKFVVCVQGGGYDSSPKCWQALLCGCIPIIENNPLERVYQRFPVVFVDSWGPETITQEKINQWQLCPLLNKHMLTLDYWHDCIKNDSYDDYDCLAVQSPSLVLANDGCFKFYYGTGVFQVDVTKEAYRLFVNREKEIFVPYDVSFNATFGDVRRGFEKYLFIYFDRSWIQLSEIRTTDFQSKLQ